MTSHSVTYADSRVRVSSTGSTDRDPRITGDNTRARSEMRKVQSSKTTPVHGSLIATAMLKTAGGWVDTASRMMGDAHDSASRIGIIPATRQFVSLAGGVRPAASIMARSLPAKLRLAGRVARKKLMLQKIFKPK